MDELLKRAINLAQKYHKGQVDKGGQPYIEHPLRVMNGVDSIDEKVVAVLHDVLEDCQVSREELVKEGIPDYLVKKLEILCKGKNEKYFDYIDRIKADPITINVKLSDLKDNMNLERLKEVTEKDINRLEKYKKAKEILENIKINYKNNNYMSVGIDGCKGKWIAVCLTKEGFEVEKFNNIEEICEKYKNADSLIIDMPIGLQETIEDIRPEGTARKFLKGKSSSIFNTPCRQAVYSKNYTEAIEENKSHLGVSISPLSYAISGKIREIDEFLRKEPQWINKLLEGHPEICFAKLNDDKAVLENKTKAEGQQKRLEILKQFYKDSDLVIDKFLKDVPARKKIDDVIDALCLAVTGILGIKNGFETFPKAPQKDASGIKMQMVYGKLNSDNSIKKYDKLVRDKIPEIIKESGRECEVEIASKNRKYNLLEAKLKEEVNEFLEDKNLEELADVMEVLFGLADSLGYSEDELLKAREKKLHERGGFKKGIVLKSVK